MTTAREWQRGDLATYAGERVVYSDEGWIWALTGHACHRQEKACSDARPLVVIDPDDDAQVGRLASQLVYAGYTPDTGTVAAALKTLLEPPKPPRPVEPQGLGAVVEDSEGRIWVRSDTEEPQWRETEYATWECWPDIDAARVLTEGLAS